MITILDVAIARGAHVNADGSINGSEFERLRLPIISGCRFCSETLGAYNAYPSKNGFICCGAHAEGIGFETTDEFEEFIKRLREGD